MTAGVKFRSEKAKQRMDIQDETVNSVFNPDEPDEDWWAAVLANEPYIENEVDQIQNETIVDMEPLEGPHTSSVMNWEKVQATSSHMMRLSE